MSNDLRTQRKKVQATAVPIGPATPKCLTFARTHQIALRIADARESELRHIRRCNECGARFRAFQHELGTEPHQSVHHHIQDAVTVEDTGHDTAFVGFIPMFASNVFITYSYRGSHLNADHNWHHTQSIASLIHHFRLHVDEPTEATFKAAETALAHAAATYVMSESMDDAWPLLEGMKEGALAAIGTPHLGSRYAQLYAHVAVESPPLVRHLLLLGLSELHDRGGEAHHFARQALDHIFDSRHAADASAACTLITRNAHKAAFVDALEIEKLRERLERITQTVTASLKKPAIIIETIENLLRRVFEDATPRAWVIALLLTKKAFHDAFEFAYARKVHRDHVRRLLTAVVLRHRNTLSVLAGAVLASTAARRYPEEYVVSVSETMRVHDALSAHERHGLIVSVLEQYERSDTSPPRFVRGHGRRWSVVHATGHPLDAFCHQLAAMANEHHEYAFHLEWANARFDHTVHAVNDDAVREECAAR